MTSDNRLTLNIIIMNYVALTVVIIALGAGFYLSKKSKKSTGSGGSGGFKHLSKKDRDGRATE